MLRRAKDRRILIVGGGPVGLFAAIRLVGFGIPITLIDKSTNVSSDIRASTIHPPSLEMMAPYGITNEILKTGIKVREWQIRNHTTGDKVVFDLGKISDETDFPYRVQFEQGCQFWYLHQLSCKMIHRHQLLMRLQFQHDFQFSLLQWYSSGCVSCF